MARLKITDENGWERIHELVDETTTAGRASNSSIQITDEKSSRQHFKIERKDGRYLVTDQRRAASP